MSMEGIELRIKGKVQGVGFRPFIWQLAERYQLKGDVNNDGQGVLIRLITPPPKVLNSFLRDLKQYLPPLAKISEIRQQEKQWIDISCPNEFTIRKSEYNAMDTQIVPDAATCPSCIAELFNTTNRRYYYPFTNCTHCGPRFTIIKAIPYDRANTSMADFLFCSICEKEYKNPADRRFHAQPNACRNCGPHIWLQDNNGQNLFEHTESTKNILNQTALLLQQGYIVAIKNIGGFHLACDACSSNTIQLLRERKQRPTKPLAVMVPNLSFLSHLNEQEIELLTSPAAPIVLLKKNKVTPLADNIAPYLNEIGVMLPSNPLQHLLLHQFNAPLVMTSANPIGQPPILDNQNAIDFLNDLADFYLCHNRDILQRADDSVVRVAQDGLETLRRARGYVPDELDLKITVQKNVLALGADLKNTFCLLRGNKAVVSQHIGDNSNEKVQAQLQQNLTLFQQIYQFTPNFIAVDSHPGYFSSQTGRNLAQKLNLPVKEVLHHHAHIVSVMAEHHCNETVIGLALDGIGMGPNRKLWGGECLLVTPHDCQYLGGLPSVALPGGDLAAIQPWRNWLAHLKQFVPNWQSIITKTCSAIDWRALSKAIERKINSPESSSAGRLFDAVAYGLNIIPDKLSWEGEAACRLESIAMQSHFFTQLEKQTNNILNIPVKMPLKENKLDLTTFWQTWIDYQASIYDKAFAFHYALAEGFSLLARQQAEKYTCQTIVLSGGVMHNQLLRCLLKQKLTDFHVLSGQNFPMGDGGLSLGQAVILANTINYDIKE